MTVKRERDHVNIEREIKKVNLFISTEVHFAIALVHWHSAFTKLKVTKAIPDDGVEFDTS